jgi:hypothetical protein
VNEYESHQLSVDVKSLETNIHKVINNLFNIGLNRELALVPFPQGGLDLIMTLAKTPIVSRSYEPDCKVNFAVGMIRMLKNVVDRELHFNTILLMLNRSEDSVDDDVIADVIELGSRFISNIDDATSTSKLSYNIIVQVVHGKDYPLEKRIAFAIKSGLLEMCFDFITRFACDLSDHTASDQLMEALVYIAECIQAVAFHQTTAKAIRDHRIQIIEALTRLSTKVKSKQTTKFVDILSSIMELNEGSCSHCNKPIEWHTALFCEGCRRVAYCGVKCQKKDWKHGTHSSDCSFLACSADMMGLTTFDVKSSRNKSKLTGLRNNIVTSQKKLYLRHESSISSRLLNYSDRSDYIAVFDISNVGGFGGTGGGKGFGPVGGTKAKAAAKKLKQKMKVPNAPKRPMNAYFLYANANRARIKAENPDANFTEIPGIASAEFKSLSEKEASKWHKAAAEDKARYQAEMEDYQTNEEDNEEDDDDDSPPSYPQGRDEVKLFVGNLSLYTNEESVRNMFEAHGAVTDCFLPTERGTYRPRGFAFVTMPAKDAEVACAKVNGLELDGRTLRVNVYMEAQPEGEYTLRHYYDQFTCVKQRKWFEDLRSSDKIVCLFTSGVFNGEFDEEGHINMITLYASVPISNTSSQD